MAKLNDEAVIQYYRQKKQTLADELQKVDAVLNALEGKGAVAAPKKRKYTRRAPAEKVSRAPRAAKAAADRATVTGTKSTRSAKPAQAAKSGQAPSWDDKIQDALTTIGKADKDSIVQHIAAKDPASPEKVRKALTLRLAVMEKNGKLKKDKSGDTLQYRLP